MNLNRIQTMMIQTTMIYRGGGEEMEVTRTRRMRTEMAVGVLEARNVVA
jgi:hypothetical protein